MNEQLNHFYDKRCPEELGGDNDTTDVEQLQSFSINIKFHEVPKDKVAKVLKEFSFECMNKDASISFHSTNNQTLPTPTPISTKEKFLSETPIFLEFFNTIMTQKGVGVGNV